MKCYKKPTGSLATHMMPMPIFFWDQKMLSGVRVSDFLASNSQIHSKRFGLRGVDEGR